MTVTINGSSGITYPAGGTDNVAGSGVGTTDIQTLSNKSITAANGNTVEATSGPTSTQLAGQRNKIINGAMMIDQRNAGASVSLASGVTYLTDRFNYYGTQASKFSAQQNAGSVTPPGGFTNYLGFTSSSAYSSISTDAFAVGHKIEGYNIADLAWGTANAKSITISFWVYSSLAGLFGGAVYNNAGTRGYVFSFNISTANAWQYVTVTIPGDTGGSGTWLTNNGTGIQLYFNLGSGSTNLAASGSWYAGYAFGPTGATSVVGTNGATFYITGVQLEKGATATPFENRLYGTELALCQRYYQKVGDGNGNAFMIGQIPNTTEIDGYYQNIIPMRASPSLVQTTGASYYGSVAPSSKNWSSFTGVTQSVNCTVIYVQGLTGLTAGQAAQIYGLNASASIALSAEL